MTDPASSTAATVAVATNVGVLWLANLFGVPAGTVEEQIWGSFLAIAGAFAWQFINAQKNREQALAKGVKNADLPRIDLRTVAYAMLGAPLSANLLIWGIHATGGVAVSYLSSGLFMGAGAAGPQFVVLAVSTITRFLTGMFSSFSGAPKP